MDCSKLQQDLLNGISNKDIEVHLTECAECQVFQDSLEQFLSARPDLEQFSPPEKLDYEVKKEARLFIEKHMKAYNAGDNQHTPLIPRLSSYFAAAACSALVAWLIIIALQPKKTDSGQNTGNTGARNNNTVENIADPVAWENVSLDDDFFTVTTDIELNHIILISPFPEENGEEQEEEQTMPEEDNWS